ncbi:MAG: sugar ABC transporter ATP-binding protein [Candidatus Omnitrophica bacterium]|nr:MAG: Xylose import ATP-binding protein XylG [Candidatus Hinthialibacteria bacterium OLB16]MBE7487066.1 sugar ABC transporter ATP-binding protein [bacterium]MBK7494350.1 sugar ABC transporter ATP-binding protein [Candidatus Omnitrophota bacterium]MCE7910104.1 sugar ABC transporter ATP-binding protein [Candidatus Omnitrophica bacterium COP1]MBV6481149.1 Xylose import ATP-binding protein XylG [bacterium]
MPATILRMENISKDFDGVHALSNVNFSVLKGEIHALVGENGAGKSTLMKILSGVYPHGSYGGTIHYKDQPASFRDTREAQRSGVAIIHQELNLVNGMTVAENIFLGREPNRFGWVNWRRMRSDARVLLERLGLDFPPETLVSSLSVGQSQMTEIAKALSQKVDLLILDEPTSALTDPEIEKLFELLGQLKSQGVTSIYISHKLDEVFRLADHITVLRDGQVVTTWAVQETDPRKVVSAMVGRDISDLFPWEPRSIGEKVLDVQGLTVHSPRAHRPILKNISFSLRAGEILGVAGLMGAGRTELASSLFGIPPGIMSGHVALYGEEQSIQHPLSAIRQGIAFLTEDRKQSGLLFNLSIGKNITLAALDRVSAGPFVNLSAENRLASEYSNRLTVKTSDLANLVGTLSGGNQQKVLLARWLATEPKILILDEPTRGIDVGAKVEIYRLMIDLARQGLAILMISSELPEVLGMSDRILVMREGQVAGILDRKDADEEAVMHLATGILAAAV